MSRLSSSVYEIDKKTFDSDITGSFKKRGARYALSQLTDDQKRKGVVAASLGNHSQGMSYHSKVMNIPCTVVMPTAAPHNKIQKCRNFGATVIVQGKDMAGAKNYAMNLSKEMGLTYINGYDHPHIVAGQGTVGIEILNQVDKIDAILVPVGGGGLIARIAAAAKSLRKDIKIIGIETENSQGFTNAIITHNAPCQTPSRPSYSGYNSFATAKPLIDKMVVIKEEWISPAMLHLIELEKLVVEGAGATGLAAIMSGHLDELKNKKGNIDSSIFGRCLERRLIAVGRLLRFSVIISDKPGSLAELCALTSSVGVSIIEMVQDRQFMPEIFMIEVKVICETRDWEHSEKFKRIIRERYHQVKFNDISMLVPQCKI